jgi:hypothetical protein
MWKYEIRVAAPGVNDTGTARVGGAGVQAASSSSGIARRMITRR